MRIRTCITLFFAAVLTLPLSGCFGVPSVNNVMDKTEEIISQAQDLAGALSNVEWGKVSRLVIKDASTGEVVREITDQVEIKQAFEPLSEVNGLTVEPETEPEYLLELWQPETQKIGQASNSLGEVLALEVTTYKDSPTLKLAITPIGMELYLASQTSADALRALVG